MVDMAATADPLKRKENYYCFICGNVFDKENEKQVKMFSVTKSRIDSWQQVIQKRGLKTGSKLCSKHFDKEDILDGKYLSGPLSGPFYNYKVTKLTAFAIPKYHLSCLSSSTSFRCQKTKQNVKSVNGKDLLDNKASRRPLSIIRPIVNAQHQSGCVSAHGKKGKRCNTIVAVKKGSTFEKPIVNNPIPIFVEDFDYEMCELSLLNKDTSTCSQPTKVSLETNLYLEEVGDQQLNLQDLQDVGAPLLDFRSVTAPQLELRDVTARQLHLQDVGASQLDLRDVGASQQDLRDVTAPQLDLTNVSAPQLDLQDVGAPQIDLQDVTASQLDLQDVGASQLDLRDVGASQLDIRNVTAPQMDLREDGDSQLDLQDVGASQLDLRNVTAPQLDLTNVTAPQLDLKDVSAPQLDLQDVGAS
uniref:THAP-type domain-containing protein n=1 Tax=Daphnia galeata TaxID=27404 RepID=A0A8J2RPV4_9CRUS|nr:unnamed protein product [Daphnia galeata]